MAFLSFELDAVRCFCWVIGTMCKGACYAAYGDWQLSSRQRAIQCTYVGWMQAMHVKVIDRVPNVNVYSLSRYTVLGSSPPQMSSSSIPSNYNLKYSSAPQHLWPFSLFPVILLFVRLYLIAINYTASYIQTSACWLGEIRITCGVHWATLYTTSPLLLVAFHVDELMLNWKSLRGRMLPSLSLCMGFYWCQPRS